MFKIRDSVDFAREKNEDLPMKRAHFTDQQIVLALQQAEAGTSVLEVCRKMGISERTFYQWRRKFEGLMPSEVRKLKQYARGKRSPATVGGKFEPG
jgi:putative transposase